MNYYELSFTCVSPIPVEVIQDVLAAELGEIGFESFTQDEEVLRGYIPESLYDPVALEKKIGEFPLPNTQIQYTSRWLEGEDWNEVWERNYFKPIRIGKDCLIRASFHKAEPGYRYNITIDPKMAFGTGNHETTYLMITELLKLDLVGKEFLDMGCGTAVLAILARMKGAGRVVAIDIDEWAYNNALENIQRNQVEDIQVALGGAERIMEFGTFDFIFANINRNVLLDDMSRYAASLNSGGMLYMSGFYEEDIPVIQAECVKNGLSLDGFTERNHWVAVRVMRI